MPANWRPRYCCHPVRAPERRQSAAVRKGQQNGGSTGMGRVPTKRRPWVPSAGSLAREFWGPVVEASPPFLAGLSSSPIAGAPQLLLFRQKPHLFPHSPAALQHPRSHSANPQTPRPTSDRCLEVPPPHVAQRERYLLPSRPAPSQFGIKRFLPTPLGGELSAARAARAARPGFGETPKCGEEVFPGP